MELTPEAKPYATDQMTSPATLVAFVQHRIVMPDKTIATIQQLNFPYLSATKPGRILPTNEAPFTIEAV
jgi:hypothetical protein